jgi:hypothetical protein
MFLKNRFWEEYDQWWETSRVVLSSNMRNYVLNALSSFYTDILSFLRRFFIFLSTYVRTYSMYKREMLMPLYAVHLGSVYKYRVHRVLALSAFWHFAQLVLSCWLAYLQEDPSVLLVHISRECSPPYLSTGVSNLLQPTQAEVGLGQLSMYLASWVYTVCDSPTQPLPTSHPPYLPGVKINQRIGIIKPDLPFLHVAWIASNEHAAYFTQLGRFSYSVQKIFVNTLFEEQYIFT